MEETTTPTNPDYIKGFNQGYTLRESFPDLADKLSDALHGSERAEGFKHGKEQFDLDKELDKDTTKTYNSYTPSWLDPEKYNQDIEPLSDKDYDLDVDKD